MSIILPNGGTPNLGAQGGIAGGGNPLMGGQMVDFGQMVASIAAQVFEQMTISKVKTKYKKLTETAKTPTYATKHDTCADLYADEDVTIPPYSVGKISTGLAFEAPEGFYFRILPRSGMSSKGYIVTAGM